MNFDDIRKTDEAGEFWLARELQGVLRYKEWRNFNKVIDTAKIACKISKQEVKDHFVEVNKIVEAGAAYKKILDYRLTRYACYLIVMNGDPRKEIIALGQTYFAVKTRQQELTEIYNLLTEDERRLFFRSDVKHKNLLLAEAAHRTGIHTPEQYATFQDFGYMGLYGGETAKIIASRKGVPEGQILDYMGSEELAANLFRITQTESKLKRENVSTPAAACVTHKQMGQIVRRAIQEADGVMPENLPTPDKSIKELEAQKRKEIETKSEE